MARSFTGTELDLLAANRCPKGFPADLVQRARRKLLMVQSAAELADLRAPPGNRLEDLSGDRAGQWSIRINDQWRICFRWTAGSASALEVTDYH